MHPNAAAAGWLRKGAEWANSRRQPKFRSTFGELAPSRKTFRGAFWRQPIFQTASHA